VLRGFIKRPARKVTVLQAAHRSCKSRRDKLLKKSIRPSVRSVVIHHKARIGQLAEVLQEESWSRPGKHPPMIWI
jgi:hypothetical protein